MQYLWIGLTATLLVYGWIREGAGVGLYMQDIDQWSMAKAPVLQVSCLTRPLDSSRQTMIDRTIERMTAGDDLIMWSESALLDPVAWQDLDWSVATNPGTVVATTFFQNASSSSKKVYNSVVLWNAQGLVNEYSKNRPVPIVEYNVMRGTDPPEYVDVVFTPTLTTRSTTTNDTQDTRDSVQRMVATAICFDLDFDYLARNAHQADLMVGPSWYWASIGTPMWHHNSFRAIENGFNLLKCSERGITGHVDAYGRTATAIPTLENQIHVMEVPLTKGVNTVYSSFGFVFGWVCVGLAPLVLGYMTSCGQSLVQSDSTPIACHDPSRRV